MTTAELISSMFGDNGQCFKTKNKDFITECKRLAKYIEYQVGGDMRFIFYDFSVITIIGSFWDIGYRDCWCWQNENGHTNDCPHDIVIQARD